MGAMEHDVLRQRIRRAATQGTLPHAVILSGEGDRESLARYLAAAMQCESAAQRPCLSCSHCRKVMEDIHPDVSWVRDEEHKVLPIDRVRELRKDVFIRPNEGQRKIYIFRDSRQLDARGQDVLLKTVEEGPPYGAFLFCAENSAALLQTIRSRCVEYKLSQQRAAVEESAYLPLCKLLFQRSSAEVSALLLAMEKEKKSREDLAAFLEGLRQLLSQILLCRSGAEDTGVENLSRELGEKLSRRDLMALIELLQDFRTQCEYNIGTGHLLGALSAQLDQVLS